MKYICVAKTISRSGDVAKTNNCRSRESRKPAFWTRGLISLAVLTVEYVVTNFFDQYVFFVLVAGFLTKYVMTFFYVHASRAS
ncbi:MAG: hypothetical protein NWE97_01900 [Candidatus Bathyarchaeota archaeon]|nr:hypothetical protein [Candidatus Bathyarchaeota archaeon]